MSYEMTVVVASLNGAARIERCLNALDKQTIGAALEIIVVDDGSTDGTSEIAHTNGARVIRHITNRGVSAARNSGAKVASAPVVAFLDDDCEPDQSWAERLLREYTEETLGVGGTIQASSGAGLINSYLRRNNRHEPLDLNLTKSERIPYRFYLYLRRQWISRGPCGKRDVYAFAGANMSFARSPFLAVGGFDESFRSGAEEQDFCRRLLEAFPGGRLAFVPEASVMHHFEAKLRTTLRRNYAYGRGAAQFYRKWSTVRPTFFPGPVATLVILASAIRLPELVVPALAVPQILYPRGIRSAITERRLSYLLDSYLQLFQEAWEDMGFIIGLWAFRKFHLHTSSDAVLAVGAGGEVRSGP
jgi:glycosyltransferase involved in cell wall biosynthesis